MPSKWAQERAELTVDNAECAAQVEVKDTELRESFVRNIAAELDKALAEALEVVRRAAARFRDYEQMHLLKGTTKAAEKAEMNAWHAEQLEAFLAKYGGTDAK